MFNRAVIVSLIILFLILGGLSCQKDADVPTSLSSLSPGLNTLTLSYDGLDRQLIIQLPTSFQQNKVYPLVFYFHGLNGRKENSQAIFGPIVEAENAIGVFPQGHLGSWNVESNDVPSKANDVGFTLKIIEMIEEQINIDENQIYSLGYSSGGAFSYFLAMRTDRFASVAAISASLFADRRIDESVNTISIIQMNGELDSWVPYEGGVSAYLPVVFASAMISAKLWAIHDGLVENPIVSQPFDGTTLYTFKSIGNPYEVRLYKLMEVNHEIGSHPYVYSSQCNRDIWEFFKQHPKVGDN